MRINAVQTTKTQTITFSGGKPDQVALRTTLDELEKNLAKRLEQLAQEYKGKKITAAVMLEISSRKAAIIASFEAERNNLLARIAALA